MCLAFPKPDQRESRGESIAAVVEISNTTIYHMGDFKFISAQMGQRYAEVVSAWYPDDRSTERNQMSDFLVDTDQVMCALRNVAPEVFSQ
jgi:L-ascorbate metabolism protein UlaG (beta-lactamase superfamily)